MKFYRRPGSVFVDVVHPHVPQSSNYFSDWIGITESIATENIDTTNATPTSTTIESPERVLPQANTETDDTGHPRKNSVPPIETVFETFLRDHIELSRWGRYICPGPASKIVNGTVFAYHDPCHNFWDLYNMDKEIFRNLGIRMSKQKGIWVAHIPIRVLTNKVFVESGLAAVEQTLMQHTGIDPVAILDEIRQRQFQESQDGMKRCKRGR